MPLLGEIRRLFSWKRRPVAVDLTNTQAHRLQEAVRNGHHAGHHAADDHQADRPIPLVTSDSPSPDNATAITRSHGAPIEQRTLRVRSLDDLQRSYEDVMGLVHKLSEHLDQQTHRTERLLELLERLPVNLEALPDIARQNARLLEALSGTLSSAKAREEALTAALTRLAASAGHQTDVLGLLQQQLDRNGQDAARIAEGLGSIQPTLNDLLETNRHAGNLLADISQSAEHRDARLNATLLRTQYWLIAAVVLCGIGSIAAIVIAVMALP